MARLSIRFYLATTNNDAEQSTFDRLSQLVGQEAPISTAADDDYQLRGLTMSPDGRRMEGYFVRFKPDAPWVGSQLHQNETPLALAHGEQIIERNHFLLCKEAGGQEVLVYEVNMGGSHVARFARYLTEATGNEDTVSFEELLTEDAYNQLDNGVVRSIEFAVAFPRGKNFVPDPNDAWTQQAMEFMNGTGAKRYTAKIATKSRTKGLLVGVKDRIRMIANSSQTRALRVKLSDVEQPIDFLADQIRDKRTVTPGNGRTPTTGEILAALKNSKTHKQTAIDAVI